MWMRRGGLRWRSDVAEAGAASSGVFLTTLGGVGLTGLLDRCGATATRPAKRDLPSHE